MKTTVPRKQMKMLEDQYEELSHLRIIATTIKLPQLNILKKEKHGFTWPKIIRERALNTDGAHPT